LQDRSDHLATAKLVGTPGLEPESGDAVLGRARDLFDIEGFDDCRFLTVGAVHRSNDTACREIIAARLARERCRAEAAKIDDDI
jgi:hypothetical protein